MMEAKSKQVITAEILRKFAGTDPEMDIDWDMMEISFKAGQQDVCTVPVSKFIQQGRRDVVEFISDLIIGIDGCTFEERLDGDKGCIVLDMNENQWQAKLKDWGINEKT